MKISQAGVDLIKLFEGYGRKLPNGDCTAYQEKINGKLDIPTIGYGCTRGVTMGMVWTKQKAEEELRKELASHEARVNSLVKVPLNQNEFDALVSFDYNTGGLAKSTILKQLNAGDHVGAAKAFNMWTKFKGDPIRALVDRRARESALFLKPVAVEDDGAEFQAEHMPQNVDDPPSIIKTAAKSKSFWMQLQALGALVGAAFTDAGNWVADTASSLFGVVPEVKGDVQQMVSTGNEVAGYLKISTAKIVVPLVVITIVIAMIRHLNDKRGMN